MSDECEIDTEDTIGLEHSTQIVSKTRFRRYRHRICQQFNTINDRTYRTRGLKRTRRHWPTSKVRPVITGGNICHNKIGLDINTWITARQTSSTAHLLKRISGKSISHTRQSKLLTGINGTSGRPWWSAAGRLGGPDAPRHAMCDEREIDQKHNNLGTTRRATRSGREFSEWL